MKAADFVVDVFILVVGAWIIYVLIDAFIEIEPGFSQYGLALLGAFISAAVLYIKHALTAK
jgi:divalent metal cation (Fe/Co/Zn/Cd) transporter